MSEVKSRVLSGRLLIVVLAALIASSGWAALPGGNVDSTIDPGVVSVDEEKFLGTPLAKDYVFIDKDGNEFTLGELMGKPLILLFSYYTCNGVCEVLNKYMTARLYELQKKAPKREYHAVTISFDPNDNQQSLKHFSDVVLAGAEHLKGRWTPVIMKNPEDIKRLTESVGIRYFWSYRDQVFVHPNAYLFITPKGRVARYLHGASWEVDDLDLALVDANWEQISNAGRVIDILAAACFSYNFEEGRYTVNYPLFVGGASLIAGILLIVVSFRAAKKRKLGRIEHA